MRIKIIPIVFVIYICTFFSCGFLLKVSYGVDSTPNMKSKKDIERYIDKKNFMISNQYSFPLDYYKKIIAGTSLPRLDLYNSDGYFLRYTDNNDCTIDANDLLRKISISDTIFPVVDSLNAGVILGNLHTLDGAKANLQDGNYDFTAIIYWATYLGRLNKENIPKWINDANSNEDCKIKIIIINMDLQEWWNE